MFYPTGGLLNPARGHGEQMDERIHRFAWASEASPEKSPYSETGYSHPSILYSCVSFIFSP